MKRLFRHACAMLAVLIVMSMFTVVNASAANGTTIDTTNAKYGFVTVNYTSNAKLKVGIQYGNEKTSYKNCPSGKDAVFSLEQGDGTYTISLCENISGTTYRVVTSKQRQRQDRKRLRPLPHRHDRRAVHLRRRCVQEGR